MDRKHNVPGAPLVEVNLKRVKNETTRMEYGAYLLDKERRGVVLAALREVCNYRSWNLWAAHVRTNHVHVVVEADVRPEKCLNDFKAYASRALNAAGLDIPSRKRWAHHGSTRWLWTDDEVQEAIRYVVHGQGEPMAVYHGDLL